MVAGTSYRLDACITVCRSLERTQTAPLVGIIREINDRTSLPALRVEVGFPGIMSRHIGYVPDDLAQAIISVFSPEMPLCAEISEFGYKSDFSAAFFKIRLLCPPAKDRRRFVMADRPPP